MPPQVMLIAVPVRVTYFNCRYCGEMLGSLEGETFLPDEIGQETGTCFICRAFGYDDPEVAEIDPRALKDMKHLDDYSPLPLFNEEG